MKLQSEAGPANRMNSRRDEKCANSTTCATMRQRVSHIEQPHLHQRQDIYMIDHGNNTPSSATPKPLGNGADFVNSVIADKEHPVTLFSLSWCSFCRAAKQLLTQLEIPFQVFELDRGEFLEATLQREVRQRLQALTRSGTLPQLFIGGDSVGGYTESQAAARDGRLTALLEKHQITTGKH